VAVKLEEVVRGGDQSPFGAHGGASAAFEAVKAAVELRLAEDRLDDRLALGVELSAALAGQGGLLSNGAKTAGEATSNGG